MPEAFTYHDMQRRLERAFPKAQDFHLRIYEDSSRYEGIERELKRKEKMKVRTEDPTRFEPHVDATFPGIDDPTHCSA